MSAPAIGFLEEPVDIPINDRAPVGKEVAPAISRLMQGPEESGAGFVEKESRVRANIRIGVILDEGMPLKRKKIGPGTIMLRFSLQGRRRRSEAVEEEMNRFGCRGAVPKILWREEKSCSGIVDLG